MGNHSDEEVSSLGTTCKLYTKPSTFGIDDGLNTQIEEL
jgi:hypothetical protein